MIMTPLFVVEYIETTIEVDRELSFANQNKLCQVGNVNLFRHSNYII